MRFLQQQFWRQKQRRIFQASFAVDICRHATRSTFESDFVNYTFLCKKKLQQLYNSASIMVRKNELQRSTRGANLAGKVKVKPITFLPFDVLEAHVTFHALIRSKIRAFEKTHIFPPNTVNPKIGMRWPVKYDFRMVFENIFSSFLCFRGGGR